MKNATKVIQTEFMILRHCIGLQRKTLSNFAGFTGDLSRICSNSFNVMLILAHADKNEISYVACESFVSVHLMCQVVGT